jgi:hypothetical protein
VIGMAGITDRHETESVIGMARITQWTTQTHGHVTEVAAKHAENALHVPNA